ncbi:hypothetical protein FOA52_011849 [Chlamydomonas sp. UWO 241]|nr:hypothetical protein FOA52_011849 [Chlamydomonas sp. UWO 241]
MALEDMQRPLEARCSHKICLFEIEDTFMLVMELHSQLIRELYSILDVEVVDHNISLDGMEFSDARAKTLYGLLGSNRVMLDNSSVTVSRITHDVSVVMEYIRSRERYMGYVPRIDADRAIDAPAVVAEPYYGAGSTLNAWALHGASPHSECLVYNTTFNTCIVYEPTSPINNTLEYFPEFVVVGSLSLGMSLRQGASFRELFHLKSLPLSKIRTMFDSFCKLHEEVEQEGSTAAAAAGLEDDYNVEKQTVLRMLHFNYDMSDDPQKRVRASDVYAAMCKLLAPFNVAYRVSPSETVGVKRRVCGYLLEQGIKKKRFSDGYYFYGLTPRFTNIPDMDITRMLEKRKMELA